MPETINDRFDKKFPEFSNSLVEVLPKVKSFISEELDEIEKRIEAEMPGLYTPKPIEWCAGKVDGIQAALAIIRERRG